MTKIFLNLANLSITASYLILAVLILRLLLRRLPKNLLLWLWGLVGLRLALPFSLESALSLIPKARPIPTDIAYSPVPAIDSGVAVIDRAVNPVMAESFAPTAGASVNPMQIILTIVSAIWLAGVVVMLLYAVFSYSRLSRKVRVSLPMGGKIYLCDGIQTPFILGILKPKIYLPSDMDPENQTYVLKHEQAHLRHHDHWWKPLGFGLLSIYWFNPLVWIAYLLFCRDLEMACDERAVAGMGEVERKAYSYALLSCAAPGQAVAACPLAFGENSVKSRIKNVLRFKKAGFWVIAGVLVITLIAAVCFLTNPKAEQEEEILQTVPDTVPTETAEEYQQLDGYYTYTNGGLTLEIDKVSGAKTRTARDGSGEAYEQTILLTEPGTVVSIIDPDMNGDTENWRLCEATGAMEPIPIRDDSRSMHLMLSANDFYLENVNSDSRRVLLFQRRVEDISFYQPATAADADAYDLTTGNLLYSYQRFMKTAPGDLNKLALALVVMENHSAEELVDTTGLPAYLKDENTYRQAFPFAKPELSLERMKQMTVEDLLTLMLIRGADDAAYALARFDAGSEEAMVEKMNEYVKYACMDTNYTDLYGLSEGQYTTGMDTIFLVSRMLSDPCLSQIWSTRDYTFHFPDTGEEYTAVTTNYLFDDRTIPEFYDVRVTGGFSYYRGTASTVCTARQDGKDVLFVILGAQRHFAENGWQLEYYGNHEEMESLINTVFEAMESSPPQFAD
ncbi:MAG: M56 family metallopeptidase [Eubacteriales bacterium]|nr:M56 family metallopeptidase [Eubacteriales bacterium]